MPLKDKIKGMKDKIKGMKDKIKANLTYIISNNREAIKFLLIFISLSIAFFSIFYAIEDSLKFLNIWTAESTAFLSNLFGMNAEVNGGDIILKNFTFQIIPECTGIFAIMIYFSCILAYPAKWKEKAMGMVIGFPSILAMNLARMTFLVYIGNSHQDIFEYVHSYLWQGTFIIFVILIWFIWIEFVVKHER